MDCLQKDPVCETKKEFSVADVVKQEQPQLVSDFGDFYCARCDKIFVDRTRFHMHLASHTKICCKFCKKEFTCRALFEKHEKECEIISEVEILQDGDVFICPKCFKTFAMKELCLRHVHFHNIILRSHARKRLEQKPETTQSQSLKCSECPKKFTSQLNFGRHVQMHADLRAGTYNCKTCGQHFPSDRELIDHSFVAHGMFQIAVQAEPKRRKQKIPARKTKFVLPKKDIFRSMAETSSQKKE
ncbi:hypothetical protein quinque_011778 [Culex quinquefasciatus]